MYNWTVDAKKMKKSKEGYAVWEMEQMVNFGLNGRKINGNNLKRLWTKLRLDPARRKFL